MVPSEDRETACGICGNGEGNRRVAAREMMLGLRDRFEYAECGACGSLQLRDPPADLSRYYAGGYYSFAEPYRTPRLRRWLKRRQARHAFGGFDPVGALVAAARREPDAFRWLRRAGAGLGSSILDVGAGTGQLIIGLREYGFERLLGIDPFLDRDLEYPEGVRVLRKRLDEVDGTYDVVMFHHSFEHMPDPHRTLALARDRLAAGGTILIRMPVVGRSWREYGADWVDLDAPRHLHVLTVRGMQGLAARHGLEVESLEYDTEAFELWGSELYRRDIPLADPRADAVRAAVAAGTADDAGLFTAAEIRGFRSTATELNRDGEAGRAAFWLRRR